MKVGDIIKVRYPHDAYFAGETFIGVVTGTQETGSHFNVFWCFRTDSEHIVDIYRDEIEVVSES